MTFWLVHHYYKEHTGILVFFALCMSIVHVYAMEYLCMTFFILKNGNQAI